MAGAEHKAESEKNSFPQKFKPRIWIALFLLTASFKLDFGEWPSTLYKHAQDEVKLAQKAESESYPQAYEHYLTAELLVEKIIGKHPGSLIAKQIKSGKKKIGPFSYQELKEKIIPRYERLSSAEINWTDFAYFMEDQISEPWPEVHAANAKESAESPHEESQAEKQISAKMGMLMIIAAEYSKQDREEKGLEVLRKALRNIDRLGKEEAGGLALGLSCVGLVVFIDDEPDKGDPDYKAKGEMLTRQMIRVYQMFYQVAVEMNNPFLELMQLRTLSGLNRELGQRQEALSYLEKELAVVGKETDQKQIDEDLKEVALDFAKFGLFDRALAIVSQIDDKKVQEAALVGIAQYYLESEDFSGGGFKQIVEKAESFKMAESVLAGINWRPPEHPKVVVEEKLFGPLLDYAAGFKSEKYKSSLLCNLFEINELGGKDPAISVRILKMISMLKKQTQRENAFADIADTYSNEGNTIKVLEWTGKIKNGKRRDAALADLSKKDCEEGHLEISLLLAQKMSPGEDQARALARVARKYGDKRKSKDAMKIMDRAIGMARKIKDPQTRKWALSSIAFDAREGDMLDTALALEKETDGGAWVFAEIAQYYAADGDYQKALAVAKDIKDEVWRDNAQVTIVGIMADNGKYDDALELAQQLKVASYANYKLEALQKIALSYALHRSEDDDFFKKMLKLIADSGGPNALDNLYYDMGKEILSRALTSKKEGDFNKSLEYISRVKDLDDLGALPDFFKDFCRDYDQAKGKDLKIYSKLIDLASAIKADKERVEVLSSIADAARQAKIKDDELLIRVLNLLNDLPDRDQRLAALADRGLDLGRADPKVQSEIQKTLHKIIAANLPAE
jgi:hypothetical protein